MSDKFLVIEQGGPALPVTIENPGPESLDFFGIDIPPGYCHQFQGMTQFMYLVAHAPIMLADANESLHQKAEASAFRRSDPEACFPVDECMRELVRLRREYAMQVLALAEVRP